MLAMLGTLFYFDQTVIVTMISVWMMQMAVHQIVDVIPVRNCFLATPWSMNMVGIMSVAIVVWRTDIGIGFVDIKRMLINMVTVHVMQMTIMEIVHMIVVNNGGVSAVFIVNMRVIWVFRTFAHDFLRM